MQARKFLELLYDLLVPTDSPRFSSRHKVELVIKVFFLLLAAMMAGFYMGQAQI